MRTVGNLNLAICMGMTWGRETWLDQKFCTEFFELCIVELFNVVGDDGLRDAKSAHDRLPDESGCVPLGNCGEGGRLHQFSEVINGSDCKLGLASTGGQRAN